MNKVTLAIFVSFMTNIMLTILKIIIGYLFKSKALIADGIHSFSDLSTDVVAYIGSKISRKPADREHPFGHGKTEYLTSIIIGIVIIFLGLTIIFNNNDNANGTSIIVSIATIFTISIKYLVSTYLIKRGRKLSNNILISSGYESRADVFSSIVVLISSILMNLSNYVSWFIYSDKVATIIVGILIIRTGFNILKENIDAILGKQEDDKDYINSLKKVILNNEHVIKIDFLVILKYGPYYSLNLEVTMLGSLSLKDAHEKIHEVQKCIKKYDERIKFITTHINPN